MENEKNLTAKDAAISQSKGNALALLPIAVFLVIYMGVSIIFGDFYLMSVVVGFLAAILVACLQNKALSFDKKLAVMAQGVADKNIITMLLIFLLAGVFVGVVGRSSAESVAYFVLSIVPPRFAVCVIYCILGYANWFTYFIRFYLLFVHCSRKTIAMQMLFGYNMMVL